MSENAEKVLFDPSAAKSNSRDRIPNESLLAVIQEHPDFLVGSAVESTFVTLMITPEL